jgi:hypothetical protein
MKEKTKDKIFYEFYESLTGERARNTVIIVVSVYFVLNVVLAILFKDMLWMALGTLPGGYRVLLVATVLYISLIGSLFTYQESVGKKAKNFEMFFALPIFLVLIMGIAYGFYPEFMYKLPGLVKGYLGYNAIAIILLPMWAAYLLGEYHRIFHDR